VVDRRVVMAGLLHSFPGRVFVAKAYILVFFFLEVSDVRFFPNVFAALKRGFLLANTFF
jgi:hypothetical protein